LGDDSDFHRENLMVGCGADGVDCIFGVAPHPRLDAHGRADGVFEAEGVSGVLADARHVEGGVHLLRWGLVGAGVAGVDLVDHARVVERWVFRCDKSRRRECCERARRFFPPRSTRSTKVTGSQSTLRAALRR
jgi:hypothetical protein